jgi:NAD(P)-dependent dehydrogenase (short-subunit alcohol dehydrogenase family)
MTEPRIVVVTGGASGIGEATARRFAELGERVVIADVNTKRGEAVAEEIAKGGGTARFVDLDVTSEDAVKRVADGIEATDGPVDVLINSAGLLMNAITTRALDMETHDRIWAVNYRGTYLCCREFGERMAGRKRGWIVNLGSINSYRALPLPAYTPGKAAIKMLTELLACEYGRHKVRVNAVAPGFTLTPNLKARIDAGQRDQSGMEATAALGEVVLPEDVADGIVFLCSPQAKRITGVTLPIDAGWLAGVGYLSYPAEVDGL